MKCVVVVVLIVSAAARIVAAQPAPADRVHDPLTMDRLTPVTTVGVDIGFVRWPDDNGFVEQTIALTVGGHYVSESGGGAYLALPVSSVRGAGFPFQRGESEVAIGNIEVGGLWTRSFGPDADLVVHGGVTAPTADDDGPGEAQGLAALPRWTDLPHRRWPSTWLRFGLSAMGHRSLVFWRADVGLDHMLDDERFVDISPVVHVDIGGGVDLGRADLVAEINTVVLDDETGSFDETTSTFAIGARLDAGNGQPGVALVLPVGFDTNVNPELAILASFAARIP